MDLIIDAIRRARQTIEIGMHHFESPDIFRALVGARRRGVAVRLLFDDDDCNAPTSTELQGLLRAGAEARYLGTECEMFQLWHNKFGVFDGKFVISGPANWTKSGLITNYENFILYKNRQHVNAFSAVFEKGWSLAKSKKDCGCDPRQPACRARFCLDRPMPR